MAAVADQHQPQHQSIPDECDRCGFDLVPNAKFCSECGCRVGQSPAAKLDSSQVARLTKFFLQGSQSNDRLSAVNASAAQVIRKGGERRAAALKKSQSSENSSSAAGDHAETAEHKENAAVAAGSSASSQQAGRAGGKKRLPRTPAIAADHGVDDDDDDEEEDDEGEDEDEGDDDDDDGDEDEESQLHSLNPLMVEGFRPEHRGELARKISHQWGRVYSQSAAGLYLVKRTALFLSKVSVACRAFALEINKGLKTEQERIQKYQKDSIKSVLQLALTIQGTVGKMAQSHAEFADNLTQQVCAPMKAFYDQQMAKHKVVGKIEHRLTQDMEQSVAALTKERLACVKHWKLVCQTHEALAELDGNGAAGGADSDGSKDGARLSLELVELPAAAVAGAVDDTVSELLEEMEPEDTGKGLDRLSDAQLGFKLASPGGGGGQGSVGALEESTTQPPSKARIKAAPWRMEAPAQLVRVVLPESHGGGFITMSCSPKLSAGQFKRRIIGKLLASRQQLRQQQRQLDDADEHKGGGGGGPVLDPRRLDIVPVPAEAPLLQQHVQLLASCGASSASVSNAAVVGSVPATPSASGGLLASAFGSDEGSDEGSGQAPGEGAGAAALAEVNLPGSLNSFDPSRSALEYLSEARNAVRPEVKKKRSVFSFGRSVSQQREKLLKQLAQRREKCRAAFQRYDQMVDSMNVRAREYHYVSKPRFFNHMERGEIRRLEQMDRFAALYTELIKQRFTKPLTEIPSVLDSEIRSHDARAQLREWVDSEVELFGLPAEPTPFKYNLPVLPSQLESEDWRKFVRSSRPIVGGKGSPRGLGGGAGNNHSHGQFDSGAVVCVRSLRSVSSSDPRLMDLTEADIIQVYCHPRQVTPMVFGAQAAAAAASLPSGGGEDGPGSPSGGGGLAGSAAGGGGTASGGNNKNLPVMSDPAPYLCTPDTPPPPGLIRGYKISDAGVLLPAQLIDPTTVVLDKIDFDISFKQFMQIPMAVVYLSQQLSGEFSMENLNFWLDARDWRASAIHFTLTELAERQRLHEKARLEVHPQLVAHAGKAAGPGGLGSSRAAGAGSSSSPSHRPRFLSRYVGQTPVEPAAGAGAGAFPFSAAAGSGSGSGAEGAFPGGSGGSPSDRRRPGRRTMDLRTGVIQDQELIERAKYIFAEYISAAAPQQVNISSTHQQQIRQALASGNVTSTLFLAAQTEIFQLLERDSWPRFRKSPLLPQFLQQMGLKAEASRAKQLQKRRFGIVGSRFGGSSESAKKAKPKDQKKSKAAKKPKKKADERPKDRKKGGKAADDGYASESLLPPSDSPSGSDDDSDVDFMPSPSMEELAASRSATISQLPPLRDPDPEARSRGPTRSAGGGAGAGSDSDDGIHPADDGPSSGSSGGSSSDSGSGSGSGSDSEDDSSSDASDDDSDDAVGHPPLPSARI